MENGNASDDGGWSMGAPGRGSGWNGTGKAEGSGSGCMGSWQSAVKGGTTALNCAQLSLPQVGDSNQTNEWPIPSRSNGKSNSIL